jgi:hypothetical protein
MKNTIFLLLFFPFWSFAQQQNNIEKGEFEITADTVNISLKDKVKPASRISLTHAVKFNNKYYCVFYEQNVLRSYISDYRIFIIAEDGTIEQELEYPNMYKSSYIDLFIKNNRIIVKDYYDHRTYYLNLNKLKWRRMAEADDVIYKDKNFYVTYLDYGEWGYRTWFKNKKTGKEYGLASNGHIINKINNVYYITAKHQVLMIENPKKLETCKLLSYYKIAKKTKIGHYKENYSIKGAEVIYKDSTYSRFSTSKSYIVTSFVHNGKLLHLYNSNGTISIAKLENGNIIPIQEIAKDISVFNMKYSYRMKIQKDGSQLLKFETKDPDLFGFIEIRGNKIDFHYLKSNVDSVKYLGTDAFPAVFDFIYSNIDYLPLSAIDSLEKSVGSTNMMSFQKGILHKSYYPNENKLDFEGSNIYLKIEDSLITNTVKYYFTKKNYLVKTIFLEWTETQPYNNDKLFWIDNNRDSDKKISKFKEKLTEIENYISKKLGINPTRKDKENNRFELSWKGENGIIVNLYGSDFKSKREIRMVIYKE